MKYKYYVVDAFAENIFEGNPAGVYVLDSWLPENIMQKIAIENNLSETAFTVRKDEYYELRWFTPKREIDLCGHATMATAFVLFNYYGYSGEQIKFCSQSGELFVKKEDNIFFMDFPKIMPKKVEILAEYQEAIGAPIMEAYLGRDLMLVLNDEEAITNLTPNFSKIKKFDLGVGVIVTAKGKNYDFVSRTFFPKLKINEDPVCGSAHSNLIPFWSEKLGKRKLSAYQASARGGELDCEVRENRVIIGGKSVIFAKGEAILPV